MKATCSICGKIGVIEQRGKSVRLVHYEYLDGKRVFVKHTIGMGTDGNRMGTKVGTEKTETVIFKGHVEPPAGFGPATITLPR